LVTLLTGSGEAFLLDDNSLQNLISLISTEKNMRAQVEADIAALALDVQQLKDGYAISMTTLSLLYKLWALGQPECYNDKMVNATARVYFSCAKPTPISVSIEYKIDQIIDSYLTFLCYNKVGSQQINPYYIFCTNNLTYDTI